MARPTLLYTLLHTLHDPLRPAIERLSKGYRKVSKSIDRLFATEVGAIRELFEVSTCSILKVSELSTSDRTGTQPQPRRHIACHRVECRVESGVEFLEVSLQRGKDTYIFPTLQPIRFGIERTGTQPQPRRHIPSHRVECRVECRVEFLEVSLQRADTRTDRIFPRLRML